MMSLNDSLDYFFSWMWSVKDSLRENLSHFGIFRKMLGVKKNIEPTRVNYGPDKDQYFLYYAPQTVRLTMKMEEKRL